MRDNGGKKERTERRKSKVRKRRSARMNIKIWEEKRKER